MSPAGGAAAAMAGNRGGRRASNSSGSMGKQEFMQEFCDEVDRQLQAERSGDGGDGDSPPTHVVVTGRSSSGGGGGGGPQDPGGDDGDARSEAARSVGHNSVRSSSGTSPIRLTASRASEAVSDQWKRSKPTWLKNFLRAIQKFRLVTGRLVNDDRVQMIIVIMISVNAIMMGIATFDFVSKNPQVDQAFEKTDQAFLIIFTIELAMQFIYHGFRLFLDGWLVFDFVIILLSWAFASAQIIRAFRIFRALRLITRVEVMRNLVTALFSVMPRMAAIGLLLFLIFYIFAVMFTSLFKNLWREGLTEWDYFSRLDATFFTLFQIMTLDEWSAVAREVMDTYSWAWAPFVVFVIISGFVVVNLIIAVICDAISALHGDARAALHGQNFDSDAETDSQAGAAGSPRSGGSGHLGLGHGHHHGSSDQSLDGAKAQIESLEKQIEDLLRVQEQSMKTLESLTRHVESSREAGKNDSRYNSKKQGMILQD